MEYISRKMGEHTCNKWNDVTVLAKNRRYKGEPNENFKLKNNKIKKFTAWV